MSKEKEEEEERNRKNAKLLFKTPENFVALVSIMSCVCNVLECSDLKCFLVHNALPKLDGMKKTKPKVGKNRRQKSTRCDLHMGFSGKMAIQAYICEARAHNAIAIFTRDK